MNIRGILLLLAVARWLLATSPARGADAPPDYAAWRAACARLPMNRSLGGAMPPADRLPLRDFAEVARAIDAFFALATNGPMSAPGNWVGDFPARDGFFDTRRNWFTRPPIPFRPFARKLFLPPGSTALLQGDLHGDIHSLLAVLDRLNDTRRLDGFRVAEPGLHLVFLGDFTDRGMYGVEVVYTLLRLAATNPGHVHFTRGNHEDVSLVSRYGFLAEGRAKYGEGFDAAKLLRAWDFLPAVLYLGTGTNCVQLCHGGMEPGYSPAALLAAPAAEAYQLLGELRQAAYLQTAPAWLAADPAAAADTRRHFRDFTPESPVAPSVLGFMWNDFTVFGDEPTFSEDPGRAFVYGRSSVAGILGTAGGATARVRAVIRGHQHSSISNPIMRRLVASRGLLRHWQEPRASEGRDTPAAGLARRLETGAERPLTDGSVWTLNVSPDSVYGAGNGYGFATVATLRLARDFADWRLSVETVDVQER